MARGGPASLPRRTSTLACASVPSAPRPRRAPQVINNLKAGVVEPAMSKVKSLRFATEAAITILRIDDMIKINPPQQQR